MQPVPVFSLVEPNHRLTSFLFSHVSHRIIDSLIYLIGCCEETLKENYSTIKAKLTSSLHQGTLTPQVFLFHALLKEKMERQDRAEVKAVIAELAATPAECCFTAKRGIRYYNLDDSQWTLECGRLSVHPLPFDKAAACHSEKEQLFLQQIAQITDEMLLILSQYDWPLFDNVMSSVNTIILSAEDRLIGPLGYPLFGGTSIAFHGAILMQITAEDIYFRELILEHIVHESAHIHINALLAHDPLVLNSTDELYESPVRKDPRPVIGIFHAMFVSARVLRAFSRCRRALDEAYLRVQQRRAQEQFNQAYRLIRDKASLTELGQAITDNCRAYYRPPC